MRTRGIVWIVLLSPFGMVLLAMAIALLLSGCASAPAPAPVERVVVQRPSVPAGYLRCDPEPTSPGGKATAREAARFIGNLAAAGQDCRSKLGAVRRLVEAVP